MASPDRGEAGKLAIRSFRRAMMRERKAVVNASVVGCILGALHTFSHAVDSASFEYATGNKTQMARLGTQWKWARHWRFANGAHIGGHWDLAIAQWRGKRFRNMAGQTQYITSVGITPVFRLQNATLKGFYAEGGIGIHYLSGLYNNNGNELSTRFQFGDHLGVGYVFQNNLDLAVRIQHFSNGGIKNPNDGVNFGLIRVSYPF
jgi:lipid A 3-O-deacylase